MANQEVDILSLVSSIKQLEQRQEIVSRYAAATKLQLDELIQQFKNRSELQQLPSLYEMFTQLSEQVSSLQEQLNHLSTLRQVSNNRKTDDLLIELNAVSDIYNNALSIAPILDKKIDDSSELQVSFTGYTDQEFYAERMIMLLNKVYADEEERQNVPIHVDEFLNRYKNGEREFVGINLAGINLSGQTFPDINLSKANLKGADFSKADLSRANLTEANLDGAYLYKTNLTNAKLKKATLRKAILSSANLVKADLPETNLYEADLRKAEMYGGVNLSRANLREANLSAANLMQAQLISADLSNTNLSKVKLIETDFEGANLQGSNLQYAYYDQTTIFPIDFDAKQAGAYLIAPGVSLQKANLAGANLNGVTLIGVDLQGADLSLALLEKANLTNANLTEANLTNANLTGAILINTNLSQSNLINAILNETNLITANLTESNLTNTQYYPSQSNSGVDYTNLRNFLAAGNWKAADLETFNLMLTLCKTSIYLNQNDIKKIPCEDLKIIDLFWVIYSNGRFGFSVTTKIVEETETWQETGNKMGWLVKDNWLSYDEMNFTFNAPPGYLPTWFFTFPGSNLGNQNMINALFYFFSRVRTCHL